MQQKLEVQQKQFSDLINNLNQDHAATLQQKISDLEAKHLAAIQLVSDRLNAGLLSKFAMIASEVNTLQRLREGGLPVRGNAEYLRLLYLDLLEQALTGYLYKDPPMNLWSSGYRFGRARPRMGLATHAQTMIGRARLRISGTSPSTYFAGTSRAIS